MDFYISMAIAVVLAAIKQAVKSPEKAEALKLALLKVRNQIEILYPED